MEETFRDIIDFEGWYKISTNGLTESLDRYVKEKGDTLQLKKGKQLKPVPNEKGYLRVGLCKNGKRKWYKVHRLVAMTFPDLVEWTEDAKGKPFDELEVNHKNENKLDNRVENLQWCTHTDNINWGTCLDRSSEKHINHPLKSKPVIQYTLDMVFVAEYPSAAEAERQTGIGNQHICNCRNGKRKSAGGYIWV